MISSSRLEVWRKKTLRPLWPVSKTKSKDILTFLFIQTFKSISASWSLNFLVRLSTPFVLNSIVTLILTASLFPAPLVNVPFTLIFYRGYVTTYFILYISTLFQYMYLFFLLIRFFPNVYLLIFSIFQNLFFVLCNINIVINQNLNIPPCWIYAAHLLLIIHSSKQFVSVSLNCRSSI